MCNINVISQKDINCGRMNANDVGTLQSVAYAGFLAKWKRRRKANLKGYRTKGEEHRMIKLSTNLPFPINFKKGKYSVNMVSLFAALAGCYSMSVLYKYRRLLVLHRPSTNDYCLFTILDPPPRIDPQASSAPNISSTYLPAAFRSSSFLSASASESGRRARIRPSTHLRTPSAIET